jgi:NAD(P)H-nitrite reductase large subunit
MPPNIAKARPCAYVIVGSGIAGLAAAETLREREPRAAIAMISEESHNFYSRPGLAYLLRGDIPEKLLYIRTRDDLRALNIQRIDALVKELRCDQRELVLTNGQRVHYDRLLLATGALATRPPFIRDDLAGLVKLDSLDDTRHIVKHSGRGKTAVVVGGGITALELAEGLAARRMKVHYFLRGELYWSDVLDEAESRIVMERLRHDGVQIHTNTQVKQLHGARGQLTGVETEAGEIIPCQMLAYAIGVKPRVDLAKSAGLKVDKGIVVNEFLQTDKSGIYAAGDCAQVGSLPLDVLWPTALDHGRIAGANMAGAKTPYVKGVACNVTCLTGLKVTIIGNVGSKKKDGGSNKDDDTVAIVRGDSESWRLAPRASILSEHNDVNRVRLFVGERKIVGALVMGDQTWSRPLQRLVTAGADITPIRSQLLGDAPAALAHLAKFYEQWQANGHVASGLAVSGRV